MQDRKWELYDDDALAFVFTESSKMLDETFKSFRESLNRSFIIVAVYSGFISFCFNEIIKPRSFELWKWSYWLMFLGILYAIWVIRKNILPSQMYFSGTNPSKLIGGYFDSQEDKKREMIISKIIEHDIAILANTEQITTRANRFKKSIKIFTWSLALSFLLGFLTRYLGTMCFNSCSCIWPL